MGMYVYKMFGEGLVCRGYKFKMGLNECKHATCVKEGFHAAENPLDCLSYYPNWEGSECYVCYAEGIHEDGSDSKISCTHLEILKRLDIFEFVYEAVRYILDHPKRELNGHVLRDKGETDKNGFAIVIGREPEALANRDGAVIALLVTDERDRVVKVLFLHDSEVRRGVTYSTKYFPEEDGEYVPITY